MEIYGLITLESIDFYLCKSFTIHSSYLQKVSNNNKIINKILKFKIIVEFIGNQNLF